MPAYVGSAYRRGESDDSALESGRAVEQFIEGLHKAESLIRSSGAPQGLVDQASGFRHVFVLLALGIDEALRHSDPYDPHFGPANVDNVLKWGMDCPDAAYTGAAIRGDATSAVKANRRTVRYLGFQVMSGIENTANIVADELPLGPDGSFELVLSREEPDDLGGATWLPITESTSSLVVRQFFYDWANESPADLHIECTSGRPMRTEHAALSAAGIANQFAALGEFAGRQLQVLAGHRGRRPSQGLNIFREPAALTAMGAAAENVSVWGSWQLDEDEALLIEVEPPEALYWSVSIGNHWWETIDYANHQSSLNGFQAVVDDDRVFRAVVSARDPGVTNWLDNAGHGQGPMIFRWLRADAHPVPATRVIPFESIDENLPSTTRRITPEERLEVIAARRAGVRRRFRR